MNVKKQEKKSVRLLSKRAFLILFLSIFVILPPTAMIAGAEIITEEEIEKDSSGLFESTLSKTLLGFANSLINMTGAQDISVLVFQQPNLTGEDVFNNTMSADKENLVYGIFPEGIFKGIETFYKEFNSMIPMAVTIILAVGGFLLLLDMVRGGTERNLAKEIILNGLLAILAMNLGEYLWILITGFNDLLVSGIYGILTSNGIQVGSFISTIWHNGSEDIFSSKNLLVAGLVLVAVFTTCVLNYQYMNRMVTLGLLIILFPIVVMIMAFPSKRKALGQWLQLFGTNVFLQTGHALVLALFFWLLKYATGFEFWIALVIFFALPAMTDLVTRIVGLAFGEGFGGGIGTSVKNMAGGSNIMGMAALARTITSNKNFGGNSRVNQNSRPVVNNSLADHTLNNTHNKAPNAQAPVASGINSNQSNVNHNSNNAQNSTNVSKNDSMNKSSSSTSSMNTNQQTDANNQNSNVNNSSFAQKGQQYQQQMNKTEIGNPNLNSVSNSRTINSPKSSILQKVGEGAKSASRVTGTGVVKASQFARNSRGLKTAASIATLATAAYAGSALSTMTTGKSQTGLMVGAGAGVVANKIGGSVLEKGSRASQVAGEVMTSKGQGKKALSNTKDRLGYVDQAQLGNKDSMKAMGRELIGGRTGEMIGKGASNAVRYSGNKGSTNVLGKNPSQIMKRENKRERLEQQHIPTVQQKITQQQSAVQNAENSYKKAVELRNVERTPQTQQKVVEAHKNLKTERQKLTQFENQHKQMESHLNNFYELEKIKNSAQKLTNPKVV